MTFGVVARPKAPKGYIGVWVNMYFLKSQKRYHAGGSYKTRVQADDVAKSHRYDCVYVFVRK